MMLRATVRQALCAMALCAGCPAQSPLPAVPWLDDLRVVPASVRLDDPAERQRIAVVATLYDGTTRDVTGEAELVFADPELCQLTGTTTIRGVADGATVLTATYGGYTARAEITVSGSDRHPDVSFANQVVPVLTHVGCNSGTCHGSAKGQNGFHLSLFGYDVAGDHRALTRELRGRRINYAAPEQSLMLLKPTRTVAHKGGLRLPSGSPEYDIVRRWIASGATNDTAVAPALTAVTIEPAQMVLAGTGQRQRLIVTARYTDGSDRDVTSWALLSSSNDRTAALGSDGTITSGEAGEAFVMARFGTKAVVSQVLVLDPDRPFRWPPTATARNYIDEAIHAKLLRLRIAPAAVCDDATFLRRAKLDILGALPTVDESRRFLADRRRDKRARWIDELLEHPEFDDVWAMIWAEALRVGGDRLQPKGVHAYSEFLRRSFRDRTPFDQTVRSLLTSKGSDFDNPAAGFYVVSQTPKETAELAAQVFLGVRIQCAQCHNHPFEQWTMDDYYGFASFFAGVRAKRGEDPRERIVYTRSGSIRHPVTNAIATPHFLGGATPKIARGADRRRVLADWLTAAENPFFASNVANRIFARFFGRGLVEPTDDVRVSNPPSHPALHQLLGRKLVAYGYDFRALVRDICNSRTYQLAGAMGRPPASAFAAATPRRLTAEQLLDAIADVTGMPNSYRGLPAGSHATAVEGAGGPGFLRVFGRAPRTSSCTCDRSNDPTLSQVLHLINGATTAEKIGAPGGRLRQLLDRGATDREIAEQLYLAAYSRPPTQLEVHHMTAEVAAGDRDEVWEDMFWAVLNSKEFLFQH